MAVIITIANQKGGVSKTTTTRHLAYFLGLAGRRVLSIDNDPQASLTKYYGYNPDEVRSLYGTIDQVYLEEKKLAEVLINHNVQESLAPASTDLAEAAARLIHEVDGNGALSWALKDVTEQFDVVLIDCGPSLDRLFINAMMASDFILVPAKTDGLSIDGIGKLVDTMGKVRRGNPKLDILGVLPTIYHRGNIADEAALNKLRNEAGGAGVRIFDPIPAATAYDRAFPEAKPVFELEPNTAGRVEYEALAEVINSL